MLRGHLARKVGFALTAMFALALPALATDTGGRAVEIPPDLTSLATSGRVEGGSSMVYLLRAREGQRLILSFAATSPEAGFSVTPPGSGTEIFEGASGVNSADIVLPASGQYRIRVYLMEGAALRDAAADFRLSLRLPPNP